jgi:hypothetical protein
MSIKRVTMVQTIPSIGLTFENVVFFNDPTSAMTNAAIGAELRSNFCAKIREFQSNFLGWQFLYIYDANDPSIPVYVHPMLNDPGIAAVGYLYPTNCYKLSWVGTRGGRHGRGRFFIAGSRSDWATSAGITTSAATNGGIHLNSIMTRYSNTGSGPLKLCLWSRNEAGHPTNNVASALFRPYLGIQRRRNYGVGI